MSRRIVTAVCSIALALSLAIAPASVAASGFGSPEDAVRAYLAAFADADFDGMLDAVAIDEAADGHRFDLFVDFSVFSGNCRHFRNGNLEAARNFTILIVHWHCTGSRLSNFPISADDFKI